MYKRQALDAALEANSSYVLPVTTNGADAAANSVSAIASLNDAVIAYNRTSSGLSYLTVCCGRGPTANRGCAYAVSYTHLDVYKRQRCTR